MPPVFITALAVAIALGLLVVAWDMVTRPGRRRKIAAERAAQRALENQPVPGMEQVARDANWHGPVTDPVLTPGLPYDGSLPAGHSLAGQFQARARPVSLAGYAANLTWHLHSVLNPDRMLPRHVLTDGNGNPDYNPGGAPRLAHCYRADAGGAQYVVGNCFLTLQVPGGGSAYGGPMPDRGYIGSAFCGASLPRAILGHVQVVPRERAVTRGDDTTGFAELDARYRTFAPFGAGSRSRAVRAARAALPQQDADPIGPQFAAFIASRADWAFTLHSGLLVCAVLEPLRSGEQARQLVADTARAVALVGT